MRDIALAIQEHRAAVIAAGYSESSILGIFVYGSQNYGIATENSDVDTKAIIIPSYRDLVLKTPVSREIHLENDEHCEVKDIRELVKMFRKQNINFLEILYTKHFWINKKYNGIWQSFFITQRDKIFHYDIQKAIKSICGQGINTLKQGKTDGKKVANGYRLNHFLDKLLVGANYADAITLSGEEKDFAMRLKTGESKIKDSLFADSLIDKLKEKSDNVKKYPVDKNRQAAVDAIMDHAILLLVKLSIEDIEEDSKRDAFAAEKIRYELENNDIFASSTHTTKLNTSS